MLFPIPHENSSNPHLKSGNFGALQPMAGCTEIREARSLVMHIPNRLVMSGEWMLSWLMFELMLVVY